MEQASYKKRLSNKYTYEFVDGTTVTVKAGEDGVTKDCVYELIRAENREVDNNYKNWAPDLTRKEKTEWKEANPGETYEREWTVPLSAFQTEEGDEVQDHVKMNAPWGNKRLPADDIISLRDAIEALNPEQKEIVFNLMAGISLSEMAKKAGKTKMAYSKKFSAIKEIFKKFFQDK